MLNRRQFLISAATVLAVASGCARPGPGSAPSPGEPKPDTREEGPKPLLTVALLSDPHTVAQDAPYAGGINGKLADAVADYKPMKPDLWLVNGDITDRGKPAEYAEFKRLMTKGSKETQWLVNTGNHDFYDPDASDEEELRRFMDAFGLKTPYSNRVVGDLHIVMLATEQWKTAPGPKEWAWLTPRQLEWFGQVLTEHSDKWTMVCLHQPLQESVFWSHGSSNTFAGCGQAAELRALLRQNPQVKLWLSGHTHMGAEIEGNVVQQQGVTFMGLGSTFYQFVPSQAPEDLASFGGFKKDLSSNQSRWLEFWPDKVVIRARDHAQKAWMDQYQVELKRT